MMCCCSVLDCWMIFLVRFVFVYEGICQLTMVPFFSLLLASACWLALIAPTRYLSFQLLVVFLFVFILLCPGRLSGRSQGESSETCSNVFLYYSFPFWIRDFNQEMLQQPYILSTVANLVDALLKSQMSFRYSVFKIQAA